MAVGLILATGLFIFFHYAKAFNRDTVDSLSAYADLTYVSEIIRENAIQKPLWPPVNPGGVQPRVRGVLGGQGHTSIRATTKISEEALRQYLAARNSPLDSHSDSLLRSPYWSTIVGICTIEQYSCSRLPGGTNWNLWGIMRPGGGLQEFETADRGIQAINSVLSKAESGGRTTIESFRGWYCYSKPDPEHICRNWEPTVLRVKNELEAL